jgi:hypothetical protein
MIWPARETVGGVQIHRGATTRFGRARLLGRAVDYASFYLSAARALWRITDHETVVVAKTDPRHPQLSRWSGHSPGAGRGQPAASSSEGLAAAIRELADSPEPWARMGANARRLLETRFDRRIALRSGCEVLGVSLAEDPNSSITCQSGHSEAICALRDPMA